MNLIFAELINCSYGISIDITAAMQYGWKLGPMVCNTTGFLLTFCGKWLLFDFNYLLKFDESFDDRIEYVCIIYPSYLLGMVSIYTLAALAIQR